MFSPKYIIFSFELNDFNINNLNKTSLTKSSKEVSLRSKWITEEAILFWFKFSFFNLFTISSLVNTPPIGK